MKRTRIKRGKPPRAKGKRMFRGPEYEDPEYIKKIEALPCVVATKWGNTRRCVPCEGDIVAHHYPSKARGGRDRGDTTPLCVKHHDEFHNRGRWTWMLKYDLDLPKISRELAA